MESLEGVASLVGRLSLARRHHNGFITRAVATPTKGEVFPETNDDFLSVEVCYMFHSIVSCLAVLISKVYSLLYNYVAGTWGTNYGGMCPYGGVTLLIGEYFASCNPYFILINVS